MLAMMKTIECSCGLLYRIYSHYAGDQSKCPSCRARVEQRIKEQQEKQ